MKSLFFSYENYEKNEHSIIITGILTFIDRNLFLMTIKRLPVVHFRLNGLSRTEVVQTMYI